MSTLSTAIAAENEIMKAVDFTFGYESFVNNIAVTMKAILSDSDNSFIIGGKVSPYKSGGLNVSLAPLYAFCNDTGLCVVQTETTEPISFEEADSQVDRIDIIEVQGVFEGFDKQGRMFNDPSTGIKTVKSIFTKNALALHVVVKKGENGSASAPTVDSGFVKLAEVTIPAGITNITDELIKNVTSRKGGVENIDWTINKDATFNPAYLTDVFYTYLKEHEESGTHKAKAIKSSHIDFGIEKKQVNSTKIPIGQTINNTQTEGDFSATAETSISDTFKKIAGVLNKLYNDYELNGIYNAQEEVKITKDNSQLKIKNLGNNKAQLLIGNTALFSLDLNSLYIGNFPDTGATSLKIASTTDLRNHTSDKTNPHNVTYSQIGAIPATDKLSKTSVGDLGWNTDNDKIPDKSFIAHWNGKYDSSNSNLAYCNKGAFGDMATKTASNYSLSTHTHDDRYYTESEINTKFDSRVKYYYYPTIPTGRTQFNSQFYSYEFNSTAANRPFNKYGSVIGINTGNSAIEVAVSWTDASNARKIAVRSLRDTTDSWSNWQRLDIIPIGKPNDAENGSMWIG